uniref:Uncharacterized protein n=1 Tax=Arundo donax TaxID=35708 RepID=A0A0A9GBJ6_ARUDO
MQLAYSPHNLLPFSPRPTISASHAAYSPRAESANCQRQDRPFALPFT